MSGPDKITAAAAPPGLHTLEAWTLAGALRPLDLALTRFVAQQAGEVDPAVLLAVALVSEHNGHGHVCLSLADALGHPERLLSQLPERLDAGPMVRRQLDQWLASMTVKTWVASLSRSVAVEVLHEDAASATTTPFVLIDNSERPLLYLRRYWRYEQQVQRELARRLHNPVPLAAALIKPHLDRLFNEASPPGLTSLDWQKIACALAARSGFAIITGGPGTGKTHTVVTLLAVLQGLALQRGEAPLHIRLAAPTGKAAARLNESIAGKVQELSLHDLPSLDSQVLRAAIPTQVSTLHRLLGAMPDSRHFRHHRANPLPADLVVVDEASMVDVEMMACLLDALRPDARLILLGDKDQLASVEAGAVLGKLCTGADQGHYTDATVDWLRQVTGQSVPKRYRDAQGQALYQAMAILRHSYRFDAAGGIGALAQLVNEGRIGDEPVADRTAALKRLFAQSAASHTGRGDIALRQLSHTLDPRFDELVREGYRAYLAVMRTGYPDADTTAAGVDAWAAQVLRAHGSFQLLTALRQGEWGVARLNQRIEQTLIDAGLLEATAGSWYPGRPVMASRNDYNLRLMNGDIGIALAVPSGLKTGVSEWSLRVAFPAGDDSGSIRWVLPSRLASVATVFAMTVHKSQGSEFRHTALVLPDTPNPVLTRELLYTGITRSQEQFTLVYSQESVLRHALETRVERVSGLRLSAHG